jgi:hypothetical protein
MPKGKPRYLQGKEATSQPRILRARWGATDGEERALGLVGAQTRSHTKVRDYGRTDVEVGLSWPEEDNHVVSIH